MSTAQSSRWFQPDAKRRCLAQFIPSALIQGKWLARNVAPQVARLSPKTLPMTERELQRPLKWLSVYARAILIGCAKSDIILSPVSGLCLRSNVIEAEPLAVQVRY